MRYSAGESGFGRATMRAAVILLWCLAGTVVPACQIDNYPSAHFNTQQPDFGEPPRVLSIPSWGEPPCRPMGNSTRRVIGWNQSYYLETRWEAKGMEALANARRLEAAGKLQESIEHYRNALKHGIGEPAAVRDREELAREIGSSTDPDLLNEYLAARRDYEFSRLKSAEARMKKLVRNPRAGRIQAHALYVLGAISYDRGALKKAGSTFESLAAAYPKSPRREAALIMVPRSLISSPMSESTYDWIDKPVPGEKAVARSKRALQSLIREYPNSRFRNDALGWLARCDYVQGRRLAALEAYLCHFGSFTRKADRTRAAASIFYASRKLSRSEARLLARHLKRAPDLLAPYLEYRIEHSRPSSSDLANLADLATSAAKRHRLRLPAGIAAQLAEIEYMRNRHRDAAAWANRALAARGEGKDLAIYVRGASRRKTGKEAAAISDLQRLLRQYPASYLCGGARENLALLYEKRGRLDLALDLYYRLVYDQDAAYILDARMSTRQVAAYIRSHPRHPQRDLLIYTLGIRQLRDNRYSDSLRTLAQLPDAKIREMMSQKKGDDWWASVHNKPRDPRKTARDLAHLARAVRKANGRNARAAAMYQQASYIYHNRDLLFYNAGLWRGQRATCYDFFWDKEAATRRDHEALRRHNYEHECLYRVRRLCLDLARKYPDSPSAPKALYRAACATNYLTGFNYWWEFEADKMDYWSQSVRLMKRVYQKYPNDPLAKNARKYSHVFASGGDLASRDSMFQVAQR